MHGLSDQAGRRAAPGAFAAAAGALSCPGVAALHQVRTALALVGALVLLGPLAAPAAAQQGSPGQGAAQAPAGVEPRASLPDLEDEVNCPVCGVTLDRATEAPQALQQRELIRGWIAQGLTEDQIKARLVAQYGEGVLAIPDTDGFDLAAWLVPGAAALLGLTGITLGLIRWRRSRPAGAEAGPADEPDEAERARLEEDIDRYRL